MAHFDVVFTSFLAISLVYFNTSSAISLFTSEFLVQMPSFSRVSLIVYVIFSYSNGFTICYSADVFVCSKTGTFSMFGWFLTLLDKKFGPLPESGTTRFGAGGVFSNFLARTSVCLIVSLRAVTAALVSLFFTDSLTYSTAFLTSFNWPPDFSSTGLFA